MLIRNGIVFVEGALQRCSIRTENGRIKEIGELMPSERETSIDCQGLYVLPGFVDIHIHAYGGFDCMRGERDVRRMSNLLIQTGTAAFMPTTMSAGISETRNALSGIDRVLQFQEEEGACVLGAHMEAPFLNPAFKGAQRGDCLLEPSIRAFKEMAADTGCVRMMTLAPERSGALELIRYLRERNVVVCAAHSGAKAQDIHTAADFGLTQITHLFNAQSPFLHREPGVPGAGLADDRILVQIIADGIHLHPDTLRIAALCKGKGKTVLITDSMEAAGLPEGSYELGGQTVIVKDGAARLEDGTLAGSTLTMNRALTNMIRLAGISPQEAIPMATSTPADSVGASEFGRIKPGCIPIFALMKQDWAFSRTVDARAAA